MPLQSAFAGLLNRMIDSGAWLRIIIFGFTLNTVWLAHNPAASASKVFAEMMIVPWCTGWIAVMGLLDTLINDLLPHRFHWRYALTRRTGLLTCCSFFFIIGAFYAQRQGLEFSVISYFLGWVVVISVHSLLDFWRRTWLRRRRSTDLSDFDPSELRG